MLGVECRVESITVLDGYKYVGWASDTTPPADNGDVDAPAKDGREVVYAALIQL